MKITFLPLLNDPPSSPCKKWWCFVRLFFIFQIPFHPCFAQPGPEPGQARFLTIDSRKGLKNPVVEDIFQDAYGFVWIGTSYGAYRFDGYECTAFQVEPGNPDCISSNSITHHAFCEDQQGNLWIATSNAGLNRFDREKEQFVYFNTANNCLSMDMLTEVLPDKKGGLWVATLGIGLNHLDFEKDQLTVFWDELEHPDRQMGSSSLVSLHLDSKNRLWIGFTNNACYFDIQADSFRRFWPDPDKAEGLSADFVADILEDRRGNIWLSTQNGLNRWHEEGFFEKIYPAQHVSDHSPAFNYIKELLEDREGNLWLGTLGGLIRMDKNGHFQYFPHDPTNPFSILPGPINALMEDRDGNIWVGTNHGVSILIKNSVLFNHSLFLPARTVFDQKKAGVLHFLETRNHIWFATVRGVYLQKRGEAPMMVLPGSAISLFQDSKGRVYASTFGQGFYWLDAETERVAAHFPVSSGPVSSPDSLKGKRINAFAEDSEGYIWAGTLGCLNRFDPVTAKFQHFSKQQKQPASLVHSSILDLMVDHNNNLWIATLGGLDLLTVDELKKPFGDSTLRFTHFNYLPNDENSISSNVVYSLLEDQRHRIWVGTETGLNCYVPEEKAWKRYFIRDGLPGNKIVGLVEDDRGDIWVSTSNNGIARFTPGEGEIRFEIFTSADGLISNLFNPNACLKTGDGVVAFGSNDGIVAFHPDSLHFEKTALPLYLVDFQLLNKSVVPLAGSVLPKPAWLMERFVLEPWHKIFTFKFASLNFINPEKQQYRYLFTYEGGKVDTVFLGAKREVTFSNLDPGEYELLMQSSENGFVWDGPEKTIYLVIKAPWYRTCYAYLLYVLTIVALLFALRRYELNRQLARAEARRLQELDLVKNRLYTNITHEFRTPLTVINGMAERLQGQVDFAAREGLQLIKRNGQQLLGLVNQILDLAKLESGSLAVNMVQGDVIVFIKYLLESFHSLADGKNISLDFHASEPHFNMDFDAEKLRQIVSNLVQNAIKFTPEGGRVEVSLGMKNEGRGMKSSAVSSLTPHPSSLVLQVSDTGRGIPPDQLDKIFDRFHQVDADSNRGDTRSGGGTGIGLTLTRELVKLLGGAISVESEVGKGSKFTVLLPVIRTANIAQPEVPVFNDGHLAESSLIPHSSSLKNLPSLLIIEDNPDVVQYVSLVLKNDYQLLTAPNGKLGLEKALAEVPDLILSDVMMAEMDGYEVCRRLKNDLATSHIPVVLLTAKADFDSRMEGLELGADAYLAKPFEEKELKIVLKKLLENQERLRQFFTSGDFFEKQGTSSGADNNFSAKDQEFLQRLLAVLEANLGDSGFSAESLCEQLFMSYTTCLRKMKALTGMSVNEYIQHIRITKAAHWLLEDPSRPVAEIVEAAGFSSPSYFNRVFKQATGYSPSDYRKKSKPGDF